MNKILKGSEVVSYAVKQSNVSFIPVYPITPQTTIIEKLAEFYQEQDATYHYVTMESEHSVMAACIGAACSGVRTFTATSGQGLLYMHELLHFASGSRLPIVMGVVNRAVAPGWNIWMDQTDTIAQRDTGWMQIYVSNHQELYDHMFMTFKLAEMLMIPAMVIQDAFYLSHTMAPVNIEPDELISRFLPEKPDIPFAFDFSNPQTLCSLSSPENYFEFRHKIEVAFKEAIHVVPEIYEEFYSIFNRRYSIYETYKHEDAETIILTSGTMFETSCQAVDHLRETGVKIGCVKMKYLRPLFAEELKKIVAHVNRIIVIDRNYSFGSGGVFYTEVKTMLYGLDIRIQSVITGLGGRDVTDEAIKKIVHLAIDENEDEFWEGNVYDAVKANK